MSLRIPSPGELPAAKPEFDADKYRKGRRSLGTGLIVMAAVNAAGVTFVYARDWHLLATMEDADKIFEFGVLALNVLFFAALLGCGIWNIAARRGTSIAPLVIGLVVSAMALAFAVINTVDLVTTTGRMPPVFAILINAALVIQAIRLLRMKPVAPTQEPARQSVHPFYQP
ncbi:hypothetical protein ACIPY3_10940 [Paenarthrobacter sp. NPDC089714]|uniref:hypothetical protein n=1 Tax=Paenarthrobacter sp. NPDC089714 TaxID=3364377 RepID=UPI00381E249F